MPYVELPYKMYHFSKKECLCSSSVYEVSNDVGVLWVTKCTVGLKGGGTWSKCFFKVQRYHKKLN